jgi:hypothetical protein
MTIATVKTPVEFGDFQTPPELANKVAKLVQARGFKPHSILEPTCGVANLLCASLDLFQVEQALGIEIQADYATRARLKCGSRAEIWHSDFFDLNMKDVLSKFPQPVLIIGNPPWVTNATIGAIGGTNLPKKQNVQGFTGLDAMTGKSNFDISEAILIRLLECVSHTSNMLTVLIKSSVARKILRYAAKHKLGIINCALYGIDAKKEFSAAVDASVLICEGTRATPNYDCQVFSDLEAVTSTHTIGFQNGSLIADIKAYIRARIYIGKNELEWRSGIKHDCAKIMELRPIENAFENGLGEHVQLEANYLYPMLKSSDLGNSRLEPRLWMIVPQQFIGENTRNLESVTPLTWAYLMRHREALGARQSSIYRNNPEFSIFGVGDYSFSSWKVAISGLYKSLEFQVIAPINNKPMVFDDTCYFLPCSSEGEALVIHALLCSTEAKDALNALVFWDEKRPITKERLNQLEVQTLASHLKSRIVPELFAKFSDARVQIEIRDAFTKLCRESTRDVPLLFA